MTTGPETSAVSRQPGMRRTSSPRLVRALVVCVVMLGAAVFLGWIGVRTIVSQVGSVPHWLGWVILALGLIKAAFWLYVAGWLIRRRDVVMLSR